MYHRYLSLVVIWALWADPLPGAELVIESRAEGKNHSLYRKTQGVWIDSNTPPQRAKSAAPGCSPQVSCGARKFLFKADDTKAERPPAAARFSPSFTSVGHYHVYATWGGGSNAMPVSCVVKHAKGESTVQVMQDGWGDKTMGGNANRWVLIGDYDFEAGTDQYVELRADEGIKPAGMHYGQVYSDAVLFSSEPLKSYITAPLPGADPHVASTVQTPMPHKESFQAPTPAPRSSPRASASGDASNPGEAIRWHDDIGTGFSAAKEKDRNVLVFFYTPDSLASQDFERYLDDPKVRGIVAAKYVPVRVNFVNNTELGFQLKVFKGGTLNLYDSKGSGLTQITDVGSAEELAGKLNQY